MEATTDDDPEPGHSDSGSEEAPAETTPESTGTTLAPDEGLTAEAEDVPTIPEPEDATTTPETNAATEDVAIGDLPNGESGLLADIEVDQLVLVLAGFSIAIGLTLSGAIRAWRRGPI